MSNGKKSYSLPQTSWPIFIVPLPPVHYLYPQQPACVSSVADRVEQRRKLNCKSFQWYLENVYPELK